jgi:tetratricopeptide (TPR) repeat protein
MILFAGFAAFAAWNAAAAAPAGETPGQGELRKLLLQKNYALLNEKLAGLQKSYSADFRAENGMTAALYDFEVADPALEPLFDEWAEEYPQAFQPYLCRGVYLYTRGSRVAAGPGQMARMGPLFLKAEEDLKKALELNPAVVHAYAFLMRTADSQDIKRQLLELALKHNPYSIVARRYYLRMSSPRRGGSLVDMQAAADEAGRHYGKYPALAIIRSEIDIEEGYQAKARGDNDAAMRHFDMAVSRGESPYAYLTRGYAYIADQQCGRAVKDLDRAIALNRSYIAAYEGRLWCEVKGMQSAAALADLDALVELAPTAEVFYKRAFFRGDISRNYEAAVRDLEEAMRLDPDNPVYEDKIKSFKLHLKKKPPRR